MVGRPRRRLKATARAPQLGSWCERAQRHRCASYPRGLPRSRRAINFWTRMPNRSPGLPGGGAAPIWMSTAVRAVTVHTSLVENSLAHVLPRVGVAVLVPHTRSSGSPVGVSSFHTTGRSWSAGLISIVRAPAAVFESVILILRLANKTSRQWLSGHLRFSAVLSGEPNRRARSPKTAP
jgi:hypothetical protein